ncbi:sigma-70 family RNA polymerase sigma factor [Cohnella lupini]|uniref:RNA polymerase sigma-70 factor (ECF subfamily) n=1 Tax=Cohnella lupini TaxID=1294267 RepID=A0A3D9IQH2_9BACL|nr:sigma-70 family RNA polymerase sigma factor [Cohnella lupini]RED64021.1 RNA polymerase sigma-70 factor (ECF subfamily) [Cohnella lupini]
MPENGLAWITDVHLACSGDREAFARLIREMQNELYGMARSMLNNDEDCADAIQEAILKAYRGVTKLREASVFRTWLFRILINECQILYRKNKRVWPMNLMPDSAVKQAEADLDLQAAVNRLDKSLRTIVQLYYFADLPLSQIAELTNVSEGTLKSRLHRARQQLASWLTFTEERAIGYEAR